jgi:hypothetical protein
LLLCVQDWDILCISELHAAQQSAGHHRAVLSTYPLGYDGEGAAAAVPDAAPATLLCAKEFDESGLLRVQSRWGQQEAAWVGAHAGCPLQRASLAQRNQDKPEIKICHCICKLDSPSAAAVFKKRTIGWWHQPANDFNKQDIPAASKLCHGCWRRCLKQRPEAPLPSNYWAAGFSFAGSSWLLEVPYCPHLPHLFFGEEQYMLLRMWTRGWDVFAPTQPLAFHQWERTARSTSYQACGKVGCGSLVTVPCDADGEYA